MVFEAGLSVDGSLSWSAVQPKVAAHTRTCAYSRAGLMWSDPSNTPPGAAQAVHDLHAVLAKSGERGPFVLAGQSLGGLYALGFTHRFGAEVAGLVLVDPSHPEQVERVAHFMTESRSMRSRIGIALAPFGVLRAAAPVLLPESPHHSAQDMQAVRAFAPKSLRTQLAESDAVDASLAEAMDFQHLGDRPLVVLTAMAPYTAAELRGMKLTPEQGRQVQAIWQHMHGEMAAWSSRGRQLLVAGAGHDIQFDEPQAVVDAVLSVVDAVRAQRR